MSRPVDAAIHGLNVFDMLVTVYDFIYTSVHSDVLSDRMHMLNKCNGTVQHLSAHTKYFDRMGVSHDVRRSLVDMEKRFYLCSECDGADRPTDRAPVIHTRTLYFTSKRNTLPPLLNHENRRRWPCRAVAAYRRGLIGRLFGTCLTDPDVERLVGHMGCFVSLHSVVNHVFYKTFFMQLPELVRLSDTDRDNLPLYNRLLGVHGQAMGLYMYYNSQPDMHHVHNHDEFTNTQRVSNNTIKLLAEIREYYDKNSDGKVMRSTVWDHRAVGRHGDVTPMQSLPNTADMDLFADKQRCRGLRWNHRNQGLARLTEASVYKIQPDTSTLADTVRDH